MGDREKRQNTGWGQVCLKYSIHLYEKSHVQPCIIKIIAPERKGYWNIAQAKEVPAVSGVEVKIWHLYTRNRQVGICSALQGSTGHTW